MKYVFRRPLKLHCALAVVAGALACGGPKPDAPRTQASPHPPAPAAQATVREETVVRVGATSEHWALVWRRPPRPACGPEEPEEAITCPCEGFAYGEMGTLDLVRRRPGRADERFALTPLFAEAGGDGPNGIDSLAVLQRWPVRDSDYTVADSGLAATIRARPVTRAMVVGDYDHDGRATEFLLQVGTAPCGKRMAVLVGLTAGDSTLHAFTSVAHSEEPLVLEAGLWERLRQSAGRTVAVEWLCGDHGSETQTEVELRAGPEGIDGVRNEYQCSEAGARGRLLSSQRI
jgi:hypothetical protein